MDGGVLGGWKDGHKWMKGVLVGGRMVTNEWTGGWTLIIIIWCQITEMDD